MRRIFAVTCLLIALSVGGVTHAQTQCGFADALDFPVEPARFVMTQDFGAPSTRHQGRYHTAEDWYGGVGSSLGEPVRAMADGRVTLSSPNGWGADGGVIIIEHTFRDNTVAYSMYGHISDRGGTTFPALSSCVRRGDVLATIADARPAPHLHFEIRLNQPDIPGAGYSFEDPTTIGWRRPTKFILNFRARGADGFAFAADIADETGSIAPPVVLADDGLLALDANRVLGLSPDGRVVWRAPLERTAIGLIPEGTGAAIAYSDGRIGTIGPDGSLGASRELGTPLAGPPLIDARRVIFSTPDGGLIAVDRGLSAVLWRLENVGTVVRAALGARLLGVIIDDGRILTIDADTGAILDTAMLREPAALAIGISGDLLVYGRGGLWSVNAEGRWSLRRDDAPPGGASSALLETPDGVLYAFDGGRLRAYAPDRIAWETAIDGISGLPSLALYPVGDGGESPVLLLASSAGDLVAVQASGGGVCSRTRVYGDARSRLWSGLGADGVLRVHAADQVIGFAWREFVGACG